MLWQSDSGESQNPSLLIPTDGDAFHEPLQLQVRRVDRHGRLLGGRLSGAAVSLVIKARVAAVGLDPNEYSGHSLRAGLATSAAASGVSSWKIRQQTGHASDAMLQRYIRDGEMFVDNAAGALL